MPKSTLALKSTITRRPAAEPVDQAERRLQTEHHQAVTAGASTDVEPAQGRDPENVHQTAGEASTATPEPAPVPNKAKYDSHALQAAFLSGNLGRPVTVFTINGVRLTGKLRQFDQFTLLLEGQDGIRSLVFKHAVTTIASASASLGEQRQPQQGGAYP